MGFFSTFFNNFDNFLHNSFRNRENGEKVGISRDFLFFYFLDKRCYCLKGILKLKGENITFLFFICRFIYIYI